MIDRSRPSDRRRERRAFVAGFALVASIVALALTSRSIDPSDHLLAVDGSLVAWLWRAAAAAVMAALFATAWFGSARMAARIGVVARVFAIAVAMVASGLLVGIVGVDQHGGGLPLLPHVAALSLSIGGGVLAAVATILLIVQEGSGRRGDEENDDRTP